MKYENKFKVYVPSVHYMETGDVFYFSQECAAKHFAANTNGIVTPLDEYNTYLWNEIYRTPTMITRKRRTI